MELLASLVFAAVVCWLIVHAFHQRGLLEELLPLAADLNDGTPKSDTPFVAVIIPARNEARNIERCLTSILGQDYPKDRLAILVVDDGSSDDTPVIVSDLARESPIVSLLHSPTLESGWTGKCQACWTGAKACPPEAEYLCFIDADMRAEPALLRSSIAAASRRNIAFLTLAPLKELLSFAERFIIPCGCYALGFCQDLAHRQASDSTDAAVMGEFILVGRSIYEQVGGHAAVRGIISEDLALARAVKNAGFKVLLMSGEKLLSGRMYSGWESLWHGCSKNLVDVLDGPVSTITTAVAGVTLAWAAYLLPILDFSACRAGSIWACAGLGFALPASASAIGLHLAGARHFRIPFWYGLLFPLAYTALAGIAFDSVIRRFAGRVRWKDRIYP